MPERFPEPGRLRLVYSRIMAEDLEITANASPVAVPEIEPDKSCEAEPGIESSQTEAEERGGGDAGCPIWLDLDNFLKCGRKLHIVQGGADEQPVCLMHSKDPNKQSGPLFDAFWLELWETIKAAGDGDAHFEHFVFPEINLGGRHFRATLLFRDAIFTQRASFSEASFKGGTTFDNAKFTQDASFFRTDFRLNASFLSVNFAREADFSSATFSRGATFAYATFSKKADFGSATFKQDTDFLRATFTQDADFFDATFAQNADFCEATFTEHAEFGGAIFTQAARFVSTKFHGIACWSGSRFLGQAEFRHTKFEPLAEGEPCAVFVLAKFAKPDEIVFDDVDLSRALIRNCDVSQVWFTSSVRWGTRGNHRGLAVFEERLLPNQVLDEELKRNMLLDYPAVAQIYQQLKKNYDSRLDYWTANEFHFGEMEMKRLEVPKDGLFLKLRQWAHRNLSLVALYRYASDYGSSYRKPGLWLLFLILFVFPALFPIHGSGLKRQRVKQAETYTSVWDVGKSYQENLWPELRLVGKSAITSVDAATFQKSAEYAPAYPWGRVLAIIETLLTSTLFALFLLAIRRQFRR